VIPEFGGSPDPLRISHRRYLLNDEGLYLRIVWDRQRFLEPFGPVRKIIAP
jgi:hypothetical protein